MRVDTVSTEVFTFDELDDAAKEKARDWYRSGGLGYEWWDCTYEDAIQCAEVIGIDIDEIYFSGFSSQGDGACFEGSYSYAKGSCRAIREHAPLDKELHRIADVLLAIQKQAFYRVTATTRHSGHYYHAGCMSVTLGDDCASCDCMDDEVTEALRDFANWIYAQLQAQYWWLTEDEQIDETILANEYEFTKSGERYC